MSEPFMTPHRHAEIRSLLVLAQLAPKDFAAIRRYHGLATHPNDWTEAEYLEAKRIIAVTGESLAAFTAEAEAIHAEALAQFHHPRRQARPA